MIGAALVETLCLEGAS